VKRDEFSKKTKLEAFTRCGGKCEACGSILKPGGFDYDHDTPAAFGGAAVVENCRVLCKPCHGGKTFGRDIPAIAKSNRVRARNAGIKRKSKFQTSRDGPFKAKIGGGVERRQR
jgi:5-methylcytosine-specific restriction protein A